MEAHVTQPEKPKKWKLWNALAKENEDHNVNNE